MTPNAGYPETLRRLMDMLGSLPGVGSRSAERMAFHILKSDPESAFALADAIRAVKEQVHHCAVCYNLTESDVCNLCNDPQRDHSVVCVVEQPKDLLQLEATGVFRGVYHVLLGRIAPLEAITPEHLTIGPLVERIQASQNPTPNSDGTPSPAGPHAAPIREVILATNPTMEGDGTALYVQNALTPLGVAITRLARGLPAGAQIEYANKAILADAISGRTKI